MLNLLKKSAISISVTAEEDVDEATGPKKSTAAEKVPVFLKKMLP